MFPSNDPYAGIRNGGPARHISRSLVRFLPLVSFLPAKQPGSVVARQLLPLSTFQCLFSAYHAQMVIEGPYKNYLS